MGFFCWLKMQRSCRPSASQGHLSMLETRVKGLRQMMKVRWFVYDKKSGRLRYYRSEEEGECLGELDVHSATFCYDVQNDKCGEFTLW